MIVLSNTSAQTIAAGQALTFPNVIFRSGSCSCCSGIRNSQIAMKKSGNYKITFIGNIGGTADSASQLQIEVGNVMLPETVMLSVPGTSTALNNVTASTVVHNCCGCSSVNVVNSGTVSVSVGANPTLIIEEV